MTCELSIRFIFTLTAVETGIPLAVIHIDGTVFTFPTECAITFVGQETLRFKVDTLRNDALLTGRPVLAGLCIARVADSAVWNKKAEGTLDTDSECDVVTHFTMDKSYLPSPLSKHNFHIAHSRTIGVVEMVSTPERMCD